MLSHMILSLMIQQTRKMKKKNTVLRAHLLYLIPLQVQNCRPNANLKAMVYNGVQQSLLLCVKCIDSQFVWILA